VINIGFMFYNKRTATFAFSHLQMSLQMLVLIGGVSRSGKSVLADSLQESLGTKCLALHQDEYVLPENELPLIRDMHDWEVPESVDWNRWTAAIEDALKGHDVIVAEGILAFLPAEIFQKAQIAIYTEIDFQTFFARRKADLRWGIRPDWYYMHVWEAHFKYGLPPKNRQVTRLDGSQKLENNLAKTLDLIENNRKDKSHC
jgi:nicotinamide/nicotinate riboside kinase